MRLADLNLLIYVVNRAAPQHEAARQWLEDRLGGDETLALSWTVILGFLRLTTSHRVFERPLPLERANVLIDEWLCHPGVEVLVLGERYWSILRALLLESGIAGNLTSDAHLAALAIQHEGELHSADTAFQRFRGLRWVNLLAVR